MLKLNPKVAASLRRPQRFLGRQLYRVLVIFPYELIASGWLGVARLVARARDRSIRSSALADICFIISSVVYPTNKRLSYSLTRTVYSPLERARQTLASIESIRRYAPTAKIVLVEGGTQATLPLNIANLVDEYIYVGSDALVSRCVSSRFKSLGEVMLLLAGSKKMRLIANYYYKLSGRYVLNQDFDRARWPLQNFGFHYIRPDYVSTRLYGFPRARYGDWRAALIKTGPYLLLDYPIEHLLYRLLAKKQVTAVATLGVAGTDATNGELIKE